MEFQINQDLVNAISVIVTAAFTGISAAVIKFFSEKNKLAKEQTKQLQNENDAQFANKVIDDVDDLIKTNIISVENTLKDAIIKGIEKGKFTKEALTDLGTEVFNRVKEQVTVSTMEKLQSVRKNTDSYLTNRIEQLLDQLKNSNNVGVNHTIINIPEPKTTDDSSNAKNTTSDSNIGITIDTLAEASDAISNTTMNESINQK